MLAKLVDAVIDPARLDVATRAVEEELVPSFLAHAGALSGYWMADPSDGHVLVVTLWSDADALGRAAAADGRERAEVTDRIGAEVRAVTTLPVLAVHRAVDLAGAGSSPDAIRVTWVEGVRPDHRERLPQLYREIVADQSGDEGFRASFWIGAEGSGEGCAVSVWDQHADLDRGATASRRRRRHAARVLGCRVGAVRQYRTIGIATAQPSAGATGRAAPERDLSTV